MLKPQFLEEEAEKEKALLKKLIGEQEGFDANDPHGMTCCQT